LIKKVKFFVVLLLYFIKPSGKFFLVERTFGHLEGFMKRWFFHLAILLILAFTAQATLFAQGSYAIYSGFPDLQESQSYKEFKKRPLSEHSKLIYLIDRFGDADIEIVYDGHYFSAPFVARVTRWFLSRHYKRESAEKWVMRWCNTSISGNLIWVKLPDGHFRLSREILLSELKALDEAIAEDFKKTQTSLKEEIASANLSQLIAAQTNATPAAKA